MLGKISTLEETNSNNIRRKHLVASLLTCLAMTGGLVEYVMGLRRIAVCRLIWSDC
jgi:hypothetical protein